MTALSRAFEAQGEVKGKRQALRTFLEARFGPLPASTLQRIDAADEDQLDRLVVRAATIATLDTL